MSRPAIASLGLGALFAGCSLAIDTSDLAGGATGDAGQALDATSVLDGAPADVIDIADVADVASDAAPVIEASPCTDVTGDPRNCGKCGHDCLGGTCANAQCQPVKVVSGETRILGVAVDATGIYWARFDGFVRRAKLDGTEVNDVRKLNDVGHIEIDDTFVYAPGFSSHQVSRFRKDGTGVVEPLAPCAGECLGIALKDGRVYFTERAAAAGNVYVAEADGGATLLASGLTFPEDLFAAPTQLLVANEGGGNIVSLPYGATAFGNVATIQDPVAVVADTTDLYVVSQNTKTIRRQPIGGGPFVVIANGNATPVGLTQTANAIYWASEDGTILRLAK